MKWAQKKCGKYLGIICVMCVEKVDKSVDNLEKQVDKMGKKNYTYIVKCRDGSLYTGWTNDLEKRMKAHNAGKGAKYTKSRRPVTLSMPCRLRTSFCRLWASWSKPAFFST